MSKISVILKNRKTKQMLMRLAMLFMGTLLSVMLTMWFLVPSNSKRYADYKFMHCEQCKAEVPFDPITVKGPCLRCPTKDGTLRGTVDSIRSKAGAEAAAKANPWKWFNIAMIFESVLFLGAARLRFKTSAASIKRRERLLELSPLQVALLRFRESLLGKGGQCPRCKRLFRFPETADQHEQVAKPEHVEM